MMETVLQVDKNGYPFEEDPLHEQKVTVQDVQVFTSERALQEKKNQMVKKSHILKGSPYLIGLHKIYQNQLSLHYTYEYVPYSLANFIRVRFRRTKRQLLQMSGKLFLKKISYQLTMLISYLARSKIQLDLNIRNLGLTEDQKLKVFMGSRCRMGHKTELSLVALYGPSKEKVIKFLEQQLGLLKKQCESRPAEFALKGNRFELNQVQMNQSILDSSIAPQETINDSFLNRQQDQGVFRSNIEQSKKPTANPFSGSVIDQSLPNRTPNLRQTQSPRQRRNLNFSGTKSECRNRNHKNSFQFGVKRQKPKVHDYDDQEDKKSDTKSFTASRSIRIELEQQMDPKKKNRKDSYKVKITTFREYEMEHNGNPLDIFKGAAENGEDIFQHFESQAHEKTEQESGSESEENFRQSAEVGGNGSLFGQYEGDFLQKASESAGEAQKQEVYWQEQQQPNQRLQECFTPTSYNSFTPLYECLTPTPRDSSHFTTSGSSSNKYEPQFTQPNSPKKLSSKAVLQEKVRQAKEKAAEIMNRHLRKQK